MKLRKCKECETPFSGRPEKIFCSVKCKSDYHRELRRKTAKAVLDINKILARNRSILFELMGEKAIQKKVLRINLEKKKFNFKYHTHFNENNQGKTYFFCYDYAWMDFSDDEVYIVKRK